MGVKNSKVSNEIFKLVIKSFELGQVGWLKMNGTFKLQGGWVLGINRIEKMPFLPQKSYSFCRVGVELEEKTAVRQSIDFLSFPI